MRSVFGLRRAARQMSPVHIPRGFTQSFIEGQRRRGPAAPRIRAAHAAFAADRDILLIEGTGHAGVGAVIGLSNARVAAMLGVPGGHRLRGRRRPADRRDRAQCRALRAARRPGRRAPSSTRWTSTPSRAWPGRSSAASPATAMPLLGVLPYRPILSNPTLAMVLEGVHGETLHPGPDLDLGHRRRRHRGDGAGAHAPADRAAQPGHRARRPDDVIRRSSARADAAEEGDEDGPARPRPDGRLPAGRAGSSTRSARRTCSRRSCPRTPTRSPPSSTTCWSRPTGRRRQDRRDQGAPLGVPVHRPGPRSRRGGPARLAGLDRLRAWCTRRARRSGAPS